MKLNWKCFPFGLYGGNDRLFSLKDEDTAAILCQDEKYHDHIERSTMGFPGEVFCTNAPENAYHPKKQSVDGKED